MNNLLCRVKTSCKVKVRLIKVAVTVRVSPQEMKVSHRVCVLLCVC